MPFGCYSPTKRLHFSFVKNTNEGVLFCSFNIFNYPFFKEALRGHQASDRSKPACPAGGLDAFTQMYIFNFSVSPLFNIKINRNDKPVIHAPAV